VSESAEDIASISQIASTVAMRQLGKAMAGVSDHENAKKKLVSKYVIGYLFGIVDATLQFYDVDRSSKDALDIIGKFLKDIYSEDAPHIGVMAMSLQNDLVFGAARDLGGERAHEFLDTKVELEPPEALKLLFVKRS
jgi:hypothetical protein